MQGICPIQELSSVFTVISIKCFYRHLYFIAANYFQRFAHRMYVRSPLTIRQVLFFLSLSIFFPCFHRGFSTPTADGTREQKREVVGVAVTVNDDPFEGENERLNKCDRTFSSRLISAATCARRANFNHCEWVPRVAERWWVSWLHRRSPNSIYIRVQASA